MVDKVSDPKDPNCDGCRDGLEAVIEHDRQGMEKYGWFAHAVPHNYHTHGFEVTFSHPDVQIVMPIDPRISHGIANVIVERLRKGKRFHHGDIVAGLIKGYNVRFVDAKENDRKVLRIILPDAAGHLLPEQLSGAFAEQYTV